MRKIEVMELTLHLYIPTQYADGSGLNIDCKNMMAIAAVEITK